MLTLWKESYVEPRQHIKKQRRYFANKGPSSQGYGFSCGHVWMSELDYKESWVPKNGCFWTVVLKKTLVSPLDCKEIQPVHPKGDQSWVFIGKTDAEAETPILWPPDAKSWLIWKDPDAEKDWGQEEKGTTEDEMVGWHHQLNGHGFGWTPEVGDGQGGLVCCSSWGSQRVGHDWATELNWTELSSSQSEPPGKPSVIRPPANAVSRTTWWVPLYMCLSVSLARFRIESRQYILFIIASLASCPTVQVK